MAPGRRHRRRPVIGVIAHGRAGAGEQRQVAQKVAIGLVLRCARVTSRVRGRAVLGVRAGRGHQLRPGLLEARIGAARRPAPVVRTRRRRIGVAPAASSGAGRQRASEVAVGVVAELAARGSAACRRPAPARRRRAAAGPRPASAAAAASPGCDTSRCATARARADGPAELRLRAQLGGGAERIGQALGRALVVGREGDAHVAVVEDGVVVAVGLVDLVAATARPGRRARRSRP